MHVCQWLCQPRDDGNWTIADIWQKLPERSTMKQGHSDAAAVETDQRMATKKKKKSWSESKMKW